MTSKSISKSRPTFQRQHSNIVVRLWKQQPGDYFCVSTRSATGKWKDVFFHRNKLAGVAAFIDTNRDKDVYFCPHGFKGDEEGIPRRVKPQAILPKLLWADLDERDPRKVKIKPTIAFESSPGRYVGLWVTDKPVTEELNRRLAYHLGSDKSGWDLTQVLRMPGTTNYKYRSTPRVKILWSDGPNYEFDEIERRVPREVRSSPTSSAALLKKYERKLPHWVRRALTTDNPVEGKRSEMIYKIGQTLVEKNVPQDDALAMLRA